MLNIFVMITVISQRFQERKGENPATFLKDRLKVVK